MDSSSNEKYSFTAADLRFLAKNDLYAILKLEINCTESEIKKNYRLLSREYHSDFNSDPAAIDIFSDITIAYEFLRDPLKRIAYDQYREGTVFEVNEVNQEDIWDDLIKQATSTSTGAPPPRSSSMGTDITIQITIPYRLANLGGSHKISYKDENGKSCNATLVIPQKFKTGKTLKIAGYGNSGSKRGSAGDLYVQISVDPPLVGEDVYKTIEITHKEAQAGCVKELNFSRKKTPISFKLRIPAGIKNGQEILVRGRGIPGEFGTANGDAHIEIRVMPPKVGNDVHAYAVFTLANEFRVGKKVIPFCQYETYLELGSISTAEIRKAVGKGNLLVEPIEIHKPEQAPNQDYADIPGDLYLTIYPSFGLNRFVNFLMIGVIGYFLYEIINFSAQILN